MAVVAAPLYILHHGVSRSEFLLFAFYLIASPLSITMGYHRLFSHATYKAHPVLQFLLLFFGSAAFEQSALRWASQHRTHHLFTDTERDPYSIKKGFFHAHIGWLIFWDHPEDFSNVRDLERNAMVMNQHRFYMSWAIGSGILLPLFIGLLTGHLTGALLFAVCLRLTLVYHATFCINSVCHMFGKATFDPTLSARDHWLAALITFGEGYHNFHHRFPSDYRNGYRWYHWDPTKWLIAAAVRLGMAADLRRVSNFHIWSARLKADQLKLELFLRKNQAEELFETRVKPFYMKLKQTLAAWESSGQLAEGRRQFKKMLSEWKSLCASILPASA